MSAGRAPRWLREPLLHFIVLGALVLGLYHWVAPGTLSRRIVLSGDVIRGLRQDYLRRNGTLPSADEEHNMLERYIDTEVLYREALARGLDRGDIIVRRRLVQKMEFLTEGVDPVPEATDAQLREYLHAHMDRYAHAERVALKHVFVSTDLHGAATDDLVAQLGAALTAGADPSTLGDPFLRGRDLSLHTQRELADLFGEPFAAQVVELAADAWSSPLRSSYGVHLVRVTERTAKQEPDLDAVRTAVRRDWQEEQRAALDRAALVRLRQQYDVRIEGQPSTSLPLAAEAAVAP